MKQATPWNSLKCFCSHHHINTTFFTFVLNFTPKPLIVGLALFSVLGVAVCVCVCACACKRERVREFTLSVAKVRTMYCFKRNINNIHANTVVKGRGSLVLAIQAS